ncbi:P1 family peptidase [Cytobacillus gottheilii]|uniref:P1 family peptidase n=1 Tax=Cytobacillus gottheilii TaxID=859144 RepID=UPI0009BB154E|nr:P1 family peptidase [Cytobacillus gottheilii]
MKSKKIGSYKNGLKNCITDVEGVKVGHVTIDEPLDHTDEYACTGVTAILPHSGNLFKEKVIAASYVINGFGKTTGLVQLDELGTIESPIMLTNTFAVPAVTQGTLQYMLQHNEEIGDTTGTINIIVGECNDSYLNSIRTFPVKPEDAISAIEKAADHCEEGAVGAGKGMVCFGYKGGIGTASRQIPYVDNQEFVIGCLVLSNFGNPADFNYKKYINDIDPDSINKPEDGSIIMVIATDVPLSDRQLKRLAKRSAVGLSRTGSHISHGSGDIVIAFSTANKVPHYSDASFTEQGSIIREEQKIMDDIFSSTADAVEEAIISSLVNAKTTLGRKERVVKSVIG